VLSNLECCIPRGITAIVGASGVGKSTLLYTIGGIHKPDTGIVKVFGRRVPYEGEGGWMEFLSQDIEVLHQDRNLIEHRSVLSNAALSARIAGLSHAECQDLAEEALEAVGLWQKRNKLPRQLSGGECQRVAIARSLCSPAQAILADEPTGSLDPVSSSRTLRLFASSVRERGKSVLLITHDHGLAHETCDQVLELRPDGLFPHVLSDEQLQQTA
jgi:ABC-type lipoprotein export system ATPase subunit